MPFPAFDPVMLPIHTPWFSIDIRWYAMAYIVGILLGWRYAIGLAKADALWGGRSPLGVKEVDDLVLWITAGVILGGRIGYILFYMYPQNPDFLATDPWQMFRTWEGGMSFHGGLMGVIVALILFAWRNGVSLLSLSDLVAPAVPIGLFFGRIANFVNGELWGRPTEVPWGIVFPNAGPLPRHPSQLYEAGLEGLLMFAVLRLATHGFKSLRRPGLTAGLFLVLYALFRISLENLREPDRGMPDFPFGLTMGMMLSGPMLLLGLGLILWALLRFSAPGPDGGHYAPVEGGEPLSEYPHSVLPKDWASKRKASEEAAAAVVPPHKVVAAAVTDSFSGHDDD